MFFYYRIFLIVIIILIILLIIILISLSIKHIYFMEFRNRRHEISTQMAFGMDSKSMILIVFFETFFLFIVSTFIAIILYFILQVLLGLFTITSLNYQDFVALLGGNKIVISCPLVWGIVSSIVIFFTHLIFSILLKYYTLAFS